MVNHHYQENLQKNENNSSNFHMNSSATTGVTSYPTEPGGQSSNNQIQYQKQLKTKNSTFPQNSTQQVESIGQGNSQISSYQINQGVKDQKMINLKQGSFMMRPHENPSYAVFQQHKRSKTDGSININNDQTVYQKNQNQTYFIQQNQIKSNNNQALAFSNPKTKQSTKEKSSHSLNQNNTAQKIQFLISDPPITNLGEQSKNSLGNNFLIQNQQQIKKNIVGQKNQVFGQMMEEMTNISRQAAVNQNQNYLFAQGSNQSAKSAQVQHYSVGGSIQLPSKNNTVNWAGPNQNNNYIEVNNVTSERQLSVEQAAKNLRINDEEMMQPTRNFDLSTVQNKQKNAYQMESQGTIKVQRQNNRYLEQNQTVSQFTPAINNYRMDTEEPLESSESGQVDQLSELHNQMNTLFQKQEDKKKQNKVEAQVAGHNISFEQLKELIKIPDVAQFLKEQFQLQDQQQDSREMVKVVKEARSQNVEIQNSFQNWQNSQQQIQLCRSESNMNSDTSQEILRYQQEWAKQFQEHVTNYQQSYKRTNQLEENKKIGKSRRAEERLEGFGSQSAVFVGIVTEEDEKTEQIDPPTVNRVDRETSNFAGHESSSQILFNRQDDSQEQIALLPESAFTHNMQNLNNRTNHQQSYQINFYKNVNDEENYQFSDHHEKRNQLQQAEITGSETIHFFEENLIEDVTTVDDLFNPLQNNKTKTDENIQLLQEYNFEQEQEQRSRNIINEAKQLSFITQCSDVQDQSALLYLDNMRPDSQSSQKNEEDEYLTFQLCEGEQMDQEMANFIGIHMLNDGANDEERLGEQEEGQTYQCPISGSHFEYNSIFQRISVLREKRLIVDEAIRQEDERQMLLKKKNNQLEQNKQRQIQKQQKIKATVQNIIKSAQQDERIDFENPTINNSISPLGIYQSDVERLITEEDIQILEDEHPLQQHHITTNHINNFSNTSKNFQIQVLNESKTVDLKLKKQQINNLNNDQFMQEFKADFEGMDFLDGIDQDRQINGSRFKNLSKNNPANFNDKIYNTHDGRQQQNNIVQLGDRNFSQPRTGIKYNQKVEPVREKAQKIQDAMNNTNQQLLYQQPISSANQLIMQASLGNFNNQVRDDNNISQNLATQYRSMHVNPVQENIQTDQAYLMQFKTSDVLQNNIIQEPVKIVQKNIIKKLQDQNQQVKLERKYQIKNELENKNTKIINQVQKQTNVVHQAKSLTSNHASKISQPPKNYNNGIPINVQQQNNKIEKQIQYKNVPAEGNDKNIPKNLMLNISHKRITSQLVGGTHQEQSFNNDPPRKTPNLAMIQKQTKKSHEQNDNQQPKQSFIIGIQKGDLKMQSSIFKGQHFQKVAKESKEVFQNQKRGSSDDGVLNFNPIKGINKIPYYGGTQIHTNQLSSLENTHGINTNQCVTALVSQRASQSSILQQKVKIVYNNQNLQQQQMRQIKKQQNNLPLQLNINDGCIEIVNGNSSVGNGQTLHQTAQFGPQMNLIKSQLPRGSNGRATGEQMFIQQVNSQVRPDLLNARNENNKNIINNNLQPVMIQDQQKIKSADMRVTPSSVGSGGAGTNSGSLGGKMRGKASSIFIGQEQPAQSLQKNLRVSGISQDSHQQSQYLQQKVKNSQIVEIDKRNQYEADKMYNCQDLENKVIKQQQEHNLTSQINQQKRFKQQSMKRPIENLQEQDEQKRYKNEEMGRSIQSAKKNEQWEDCKNHGFGQSHSFDVRSNLVADNSKQGQAKQSLKISESSKFTTKPNHPQNRIVSYSSSNPQNKVIMNSFDNTNLAMQNNNQQQIYPNQLTTPQNQQYQQIKGQQQITQEQQKVIIIGGNIKNGQQKKEQNNIQQMITQKAGINQYQNLVSSDTGNNQKVFQKVISDQKYGPTRKLKQTNNNLSGQKNCQQSPTEKRRIKESRMNEKESQINQEITSQREVMRQFQINMKRDSLAEEEQDILFTKRAIKSNFYETVGADSKIQQPVLQTILGQVIPRTNKLQGQPSSFGIRGEEKVTTRGLNKGTNARVNTFDNRGMNNKQIYAKQSDDGYQVNTPTRSLQSSMQANKHALSQQQDINFEGGSIDLNFTIKKRKSRQVKLCNSRSSISITYSTNQLDYSR